MVPGHRFPVEIISQCVWLNHRFPLSLRDLEEMMANAVSASPTTPFTSGAANLGRPMPRRLRRRPRPDGKWHLDEVFIKIGGKTHYLRRAVDQHGNVLDILVTSHRDVKAVTRFLS